MNAEAFAAKLNELQAKIGKRQFRTLNIAFRDYLTQRRNRKLKSQSQNVEGPAMQSSDFPLPAAVDNFPGHVVSRVAEPTPSPTMSTRARVSSIEDAEVELYSSNSTNNSQKHYYLHEDDTRKR
jgi:hypothetical protein